jgi:Ca2+-binding EF-hand superfamily protein
MPQIAVRVTLGERDQKRRGIEIISMSPALGLKKPTDIGTASANAAELLLSGTKLRFVIGVVNRRPPDFDDLAKREMKLRDEDGNAILEGGELDALANTALSQAYGRWDSNRDGKVTLAEIKADYQREHDVRWSQAEVTTAAEIPSLFQLVDLNGDRRLSLREMRGAQKQMLKLDEDGDGDTEPDERHGRITIVFSRAHEKYSTDVFRMQQVKPATASRKVGNPPDWFVRMDRNHDKDISPREFLGSSKVFDRIDRDSDGLIDPSEAEKAGDGG